MWVGDDDLLPVGSQRSREPVRLRHQTTKQVTEVVKNDGLDFKSASAGPGAIVIEQFGALKLFDTATQQGADGEGEPGAATFPSCGRSS